MKGAESKSGSDNKEEFRQGFKEKHPNNKAVSFEKAPYAAKAETRKTEYEKAMRAYNNGDMDANESENPKAVAGEEQLDKSVSEIEDEGEDDYEQMYYVKHHLNF